MTFLSQAARGAMLLRLPVKGTLSGGSLIGMAFPSQAVCSGGLATFQALKASQGYVDGR